MSPSQGTVRALYGHCNAKTKTWMHSKIGGDLVDGACSSAYAVGDHDRTPKHACNQGQGREDNHEQMRQMAGRDDGDDDGRMIRTYWQ